MLGFRLSQIREGGPQAVGPHAARRWHGLVCIVEAMFLAVWAAGSARAQVTVEARVDSGSIVLGEQTLLHLRVSAPQGQKVVWPDLQQGTVWPEQGGMEVVKVGPVDTLESPGSQGGSRHAAVMRLHRAYTLTRFEPGLVSLPKLGVNVEGKTYATSAPVGALKVRDVRVDTLHTEKFNPPFGPLPAPWHWNAWPWVLLSVWLALAWAAWRLLRLLRKAEPLRRRKTIYPPEGPCHKAMRLLQALPTQQEMTQQENKQYFVQLTDVVRRYLCERYGLSAEQRTTRETEEALRDLVSAQHQRQLGELLRAGDAAKFAREMTTPFLREHLLRQTREFLESTRLLSQEEAKPHVEIVELSAPWQTGVRVAELLGLAVSGVALLGLPGWGLWWFFNA